MQLKISKKTNYNIVIQRIKDTFVWRLYVLMQAIKYANYNSTIENFTYFYDTCHSSSGYVWEVGIQMISFFIFFWEVISEFPTTNVTTATKKKSFKNVLWMLFFFFFQFYLFSKFISQDNLGYPATKNKPKIFSDLTH